VDQGDQAKRGLNLDASLEQISPIFQLLVPGPFGVGLDSSHISLEGGQTAGVLGLPLPTQLCKTVQWGAPRSCDRLNTRPSKELRLCRERNDGR
jgi:hypothetical protein